LDINTEQGDKVLSSLQEEFGSMKNTTFSFHHCNVASWESQAAAFADIIAAHGHIDIVHANAGVAEKGAFMEPSEKPTKPNMLSADINFYGVLYSEFAKSQPVARDLLPMHLPSCPSRHVLHEQEPNFNTNDIERQHYMYSV
jgi:NAD(P)-dependent dehydrogenase (short-subunit alcohol dehydrogenase family)